MFKNPLKYASGGDMLSSEQQAENDFISVIAEGLGAQPEQVKARLEQIKSNPTESQQLQEALQLMQQDKNKGFQAVLSLFAGKPQSAKRGGKIQDFICKHAKGGVAGCGCKKPIEKHQQEDNKGRGIIGVPQYTVAQDTTFFNPRGEKINQRVIVDENGQAFKWNTINGTNPIAIGGYWDGEFIPEGDDTIPVQRFESLFRRAIPKQKPQSNQNIVKDQKPAGPMPDPSYFGTISQGKPRSKVSQAIDNNSKARNFVKGVKQFVNSPMVRLPLAGAAAYGGWKLSGIPIIQETGEIAPKIAPYLFPFLSQLRPKFVVDTINPMTTPEKSWHNTFWAMPEDNIMDKIDK